MVNEIDDIVDLFEEFYFVDETPTPKPKETENHPKINFEGSNENGLVFVFADTLSAIDEDMIYKLIHNAMKIKIQDMALVHLTKNGAFTAEVMINIMQPKQVVLFGENTLFQSVQFSEMYTVQFIHKIPFLQVDSVDIFHSDIALKTKLWQGIQQLLAK